MISALDAYAVMQHVARVNAENEMLAACVAWLEAQLGATDTDVDARWRLNRNQAKLVSLLLQAKGRMVSHDRIISAIWSVDLPENPTNAVHGLVCRARAKIRPFGFTIRASRRFGYAIPLLAGDSK